MDSRASVLILQEHLHVISGRAHRDGWIIQHDGLFVEAILPQIITGLKFRLMLYCEGYPRHPLKAQFLPDPARPSIVRWPTDEERVFRVTTGPFICMAGLESYIPEDVSSTPYSPEDIHIGKILNHIFNSINSDNCSSIELVV